MNDDSEHKLRFLLRPAPVLPDHRRMFKVSQILLTLELASRGGRSSLPRLQLFNWAFKRPEHQIALTRSAESGVLDVSTWGFDPTIVIALRFAYAEKLLSLASTGYQLSDTGKLFSKEIIADPELLASEKTFLLSVGKRITEKMIEAVVDKWNAQ